MRMSCNGCRVLRKGCSADCTIRPCLQWIKSPESQANATLFLSKFYGRAGLMNLIDGSKEELRPAIFRSLLYEACGRMVSPVYGSIGLLWSGGWDLCQAAVEAVLKGAPIVQASSDPGGEKLAGALNEVTSSSYDIRHVSKAATTYYQRAAAGSTDAFLRKLNSAKGAQFKRTGRNSGKHENGGAPPRHLKGLQWCSPVHFPNAQSQESSICQDSVETGDTSVLTAHGVDSLKNEPRTSDDCRLEIELDLTLGMKSVNWIS